jgi:hypothetical protein
MGINAAPTAPAAAAMLSSAGFQQDGSIAALAIAVCIGVRSHDVGMLASRPVALGPK